MIHAAADLKRTLSASLDFEAALIQLRSVKTETDMREAARLLDNPEFEHLSPDAQLELMSAYAAVSQRFMGFLG